jgi:Xaa-Pro aminopeptidase
MTVGLIGAHEISSVLMDHLRRALPAAVFVDATHFVDQIKSVKSEDERALIRRTAEMQDGAMAAAFAAVKPGMRESDVAAVAQSYCQQRGSEQGLYLCGSFSATAPSMPNPRHLQNKIIDPGDYVALLVEASGPGGFYTELGRTCVLGTVSQEVQEELDFTLEARRLTLSLLKPGANTKDIWEAYNDFMRTNGRPEESRLYCHGQGYDLVERPLVRYDEPMPIAQHNNIVVHPTYIKGNVMSWICDNFFIEADGPSDRLHSFPEIITEIG